MAMCHIAKYFKKVMCMVAHDSCGFGLEDDGDGDGTRSPVAFCQCSCC